MFRISIRKLAVLALGLALLLAAACTAAPEGVDLPGTGNGETPEAEVPETEMPETEPTTEAAAPDALENTFWVLESFEEQGEVTAVLEGAPVTLEFGEAGLVGGSGGCNSYGGQVVIGEGTISFSEVVSTLMACADEGLMDQEARFHQALESASEYQLSGDRLQIFYDGGEGVLTFVRSEPSETPEAGGDLVGTAWTLQSFEEAGSEALALEGFTITLEFQDGAQVSGSGGCNMYSAGYQAQDGSLSFGPVTSTRRACTDEGATQQEQRFFQALEAAESFELSGDSLVIRYNGGESALHFVRG